MTTWSTSLSTLPGHVESATATLLVLRDRLLRMCPLTKVRKFIVSEQTAAYELKAALAVIHLMLST